jgi:hypothetical protein
MAFSNPQISSLNFITLLLALHSSSVSAQQCFNNSKLADNSTDDKNELALPPISLSNATGSISFPGFAYPREGASNWTLSTALYYDNSSTAEYKFPRGSIWLNTDPIQNLSSANLPYYGCVFSFATNDRKESKGSGEKNNTCNGVLSQKCFDHLISTAHGAALRLIGRNDTDNFCDEIADAKEDDWDSTCSGEIALTQYPSGTKTPVHDLTVHSV